MDGGRRSLLGRRRSEAESSDCCGTVLTESSERVGLMLTSSPHALHVIEQLHNSHDKTTLQGDTDMKTGMHGLTPPQPTVPPDLHVTGAKNASEALLAHATHNATGAA